jgi:alcohol dehydrogenase
MAQKSLAAVLEAPRKVSIRSLEIPKIGEDEILLETEMAGICGSDVKTYNADMKVVEGQIYSPYNYPFIMGDEILGRIAQIGEKAAKRRGLIKGDRVIVEAYIACGWCDYCKGGHYQFCRNAKIYGTISTNEYPGLWGGYSEYVYVPSEARTHKISDDVPAKAAILTGCVADGLRWIEEKGQVSIGDVVVIIGPGPQGLSSTLAAKNRGAGMVVVAGITRDKERLNLAKKMGADYTVDAEKENLVSRVREITDAEMADVVIEASGNPKAVQDSLDLVKPLGKIVHISITGGREIPLVTQKIVFKELSFLGGVWPYPKVGTAIKLIESIVKSRRYPIEEMISHEFPLERADEAVRTMGHEVKGVEPIKVALHFKSSASVS